MDGIIICDKDKNITSFDLIRKLRIILHEKKIGHTGTLDPLATGLMIVCVGKCTKLAELIESMDKSYIVEFVLGMQTDSYDITGKIINEKLDFTVSKEQLISTTSLFLGNQTQVPPMYSAIKKNGQPLYKLARQGISIERKAREVVIHNLQLIDFNGKKCKMKCDVSKGTYIRSLVNDIGEKLGCYATMTELRRILIGNININSSFTVDKIQEKLAREEYDFLQQAESFFNYKSIIIRNNKDFVLFKNGNTVIFEYDDGIYSVYYRGKFVGFGEIYNNRLKGYKYF